MPLSVLPFIAATFSLLCTVGDCWLVGESMGLNYAGQKGRDDWVTWPPCLLPSLVFVVIRELFRSNRGEDTEQGIEIQSQET